MHPILPFLIFGIGLDDMFLIVGAGIISFFLFCLKTGILLSFCLSYRYIFLSFCRSGIFLSVFLTGIYFFLSVVRTPVEKVLKEEVHYYEHEHEEEENFAASKVASDTNM